MSFSQTSYSSRYGFLDFSITLYILIAFLDSIALDSTNGLKNNKFLRQSCNMSNDFQTLYDRNFDTIVRHITLLPSFYSSTLYINSLSLFSHYAFLRV